MVNTAAYEDTSGAEAEITDHSHSPYMAAGPRLSELEGFTANQTLEQHSYQEQTLPLDGQQPQASPKPYTETPANGSEKPEVRVYELRDGDAIVEVRENTATTTQSMLENPLNNY